MSFSGPDPYGTPGGEDDIGKPQFPEDVRVAETSSLVLYLLVNGPVTLRDRENLEEVVRVLDFSFPGLVIRSFNTIFDKNVTDIDFIEGVTVVSAGVGSIDILIGVNDIVTSLFAPGSVTTAKMLDANVTLVKLAANSVNSSKIVDDSIVNADINAAAGIVGSKFSAGTITATQLAANSVQTAEIVDANVTLAKLASGSVGAGNIIDGSIVNADVNASAAIAFSKLSGVAAAVHSHTPTITIVSAVTAVSTLIEVDCPVGTVVISGGCFTPEAGQRIRESGPCPNVGACNVAVNGWACNMDGTAQPNTVYAICLSTPIT